MKKDKIKARNSRSQNTKRHGLHGTPTYKVWRAMRKRCNQPSLDSYERYGGRGVRVCERWASFQCFLEDMGEKPSPSHSIDRIDNNGNYEPNNCRWATCEEQARNRSNSIKLELNGISKTLPEWSEATGIKYITLYYRYRKGWSVEKILR